MSAAVSESVRLPIETNAHLPSPSKTKPSGADFKQVLLGADRDLKFEVDENTHQIRVQVVDTSTGQVIKQLNPAEGLIFDQHS